MISTTIYIATVLAVVIVASLIVRHQLSRNKQLEKLIAHNNDKLERLQLNFSRFTPEEVIEHLTEADGSYQPNMREVTVLFADLQGFTQMCAGMSPSEVVSILNGYFRIMNDVISKHHGQVTELLGDGMLALFGALRNNPWQTQDAVLASIAMRKALDAYNIELRVRYKLELSFGIGIHRGEVLAAIMGNFDLSKFGVVGDTINIAARVEALTRKHEVDILITEDVFAAIDDRFDLVEMPPEMVKGKQDALVTYFVKGIMSNKDMESTTNIESS